MSLYYVCMHVLIHVEAHVCRCVHMCTHDGYLLLISLYWDKVSCWTWKFPIWLPWVSPVSASWVLELWVGHYATGFYVSAGYLNSGAHTGEPTLKPCDILLFFETSVRLREMILSFLVIYIFYLSVYLWACQYSWYCQSLFLFSMILLFSYSVLFILA